MLRSVLAASLRQVRRSFAWWSLGLAALVALLAAVYPSVRESPELDELVERYPDALKGFFSFGGELDFLSPAGFLGSELFSFMAPLLFLIALVGRAAGTLAGEEERGTLELLLANPVSRRRLALEKLAAVALEAIGLGAVLLAALWVGGRAAAMGVPADRLAAATAAVVLLALAFAALAFAVGAATGSRARAIAITAAVAVAAFLLNALAELVDALEAVRPLSLFYHYSAGDPLRRGPDLVHGGILLAVAAVLALAAPLLFERRDLR